MVAVVAIVVLAVAVVVREAVVLQVIGLVVQAVVELLGKVMLVVALRMALTHLVQVVVVLGRQVQIT